MTLAGTGKAGFAYIGIQLVPGWKDSVDDMIRKMWEQLQFKDYELFREDIEQRNLETLGRMGIVGVSIALFSIGLHLIIDPKKTPVELIIFLLYILVVLYFYHEEKDSLKHATAALYTFVGIAFAGAICTGTFLNPEHVAFTFILFIMALPRFILDKPVRVSVFILASGTIFTIMAAYYKLADIFASDLNHMIVAIPLCMGVNFFSLTSQIENVRHGTNMQRQSEHDPLTKIFNRNGGIIRIERCMTNMRGGTFIFLDVDHFKHINDTYGHEQGDVVLKNIAKMLQDSFRASDIVMRFGGDEFCVYCPDLLDSDFVKQKLQELLASARLIPENQEENEFCTISIGCIINDGWYPDFKTIMASADKLLYKSKNNGRDQFHYSGKSYKGSKEEAENLQRMRDQAAAESKKQPAEEGSAPNAETKA